MDPITELELDGQRITLTRPSVHGLILDLEVAPGHRVHLRVFQYHTGLIAGQETELPKPLAVIDAITHLRSGMQAVREFLVRQPIAAAADLEASGQHLANTLQALRPQLQEGGAA